MKKRFLLSSLAAALWLALNSAATAAIFMEIEGIPGESKDADHADWIDVNEVNVSISRVIDPETGRPTGKRNVDKFCISKPIDKSSPLLARAAVIEGETLPKVVIELTREADPAGDCPKVYLKYELTDVLITSYSSRKDADNPPGTEEICLSFGSVKLTHYPCSEDGTPGEPVTSTIPGTGG